MSDIRFVYYGRVGVLTRVRTVGATSDCDFSQVPAAIVVLGNRDEPDAISDTFSRLLS